MRNVSAITTALMLLTLSTATVSAQSTGEGWLNFIAEWDALVRQAEELYADDQYAAAVDVSKQALKLAKSRVDADHFAVAESLNNLAFLYHQLHEYAKAEPLFKQALAIREKALRPNDADVVASLNN